jgi:hypothetical protein
MGIMARAAVYTLIPLYTQAPTPEHRRAGRWPVYALRNPCLRAPPLHYDLSRHVGVHRTDLSSLVVDRIFLRLHRIQHRSHPLVGWPAASSRPAVCAGRVPPLPNRWLRGPPAGRPGPEPGPARHPPRGRSCNDHSDRRWDDLAGNAVSPSPQAARVGPKGAPRIPPRRFDFAGRAKDVRHHTVGWSRGDPLSGLRGWGRAYGMGSPGCCLGRSSRLPRADLWSVSFGGPSPRPLPLPLPFGGSVPLFPATACLSASQTTGRAAIKPLGLACSTRRAFYEVLANR